MCWPQCCCVALLRMSAMFIHSATTFIQPPQRKAYWKLKVFLVSVADENGCNQSSACEGSLHRSVNIHHLLGKSLSVNRPDLICVGLGGMIKNISCEVHTKQHFDYSHNITLMVKSILWVLLSLSHKISLLTRSLSSNGVFGWVPGS